MRDLMDSAGRAEAERRVGLMVAFLRALGEEIGSGYQGIGEMHGAASIR